MTKKLLSKFNFKFDKPIPIGGIVKILFIILIYLGGMSNLSAANSDNYTKVVISEASAEEVNTNPQIIKSYKITDASTYDKSCFPTAGRGVIFQRADGCEGEHSIWRAGNDLILNEFDDNTARITGTVISESGALGTVNIALYDKSNQGKTWKAECYVSNVADARNFYQSFNGSITVNGTAYTIEVKQSEQHFILADGAGFDAGQFGFGAWTGGSFGGCTEWFGALKPIEVNCDLTVDAGEDQSNCSGEEIVLTATTANESVCNEIISSYKITDSQTEAGCFTADPGVIFQKGGSCKGIDNIWSAGTDLVLNEFADNTATISGSLIGQNGQTATISMKLYDKENSGRTWNASCYLDGISGPETYYRSFTGAITVNGVSQVVGTRFGAHFILANGAGFDSNQYGLGAWTGGPFGECTEWFGNLVPMETENLNQSVEYLWSTGETTQSITVSESGEYTVTVTDCEGCTATDAVTVEIVNPKAYALEGGASFCIDGTSDFLTANDISVSGNVMGSNSTFVVTDEQGNILGLPPTLDAVMGVDFDGAGPGTCLVWHLSFEDGLQGAAVGENANNLEGCYDLSNPIEVVRNQGSMANAGDDVYVCAGEEVMLTATGGGSYLWSTGEATASIKVVPTATTTYMVTVTSDAGCESTDKVDVIIIDKVTIGDFVWLDENRNGLQDDGATGVNDVTVKLHQCDGTVIASTVTADNANGEAGAYSFDVCPNSGEYYIVFGNTPEGTEFTAANAGDGANDSDANENGRTDCFEVTDIDNIMIDGGLTEICDIKVDAGDDISICTNETVEITANLIENTADCPGVCVYPIIEQERCYGADGTFEIFLLSTTGNIQDAKFKASEQHFERNSDNILNYSATATNGLDVITLNVSLTGYTTNTPEGSPKENMCQQYDTTAYEYWTAWEGTLVSENHGTFEVSIRGEAFQMGEGADVTRTGFGASGWFNTSGGDGFYTNGDVNVIVDTCVDSGVIYNWTTEDGRIVGNPNQKTITVVGSGTYTVEAINCIDCVTTDTVVVNVFCIAVAEKASATKMSSVYPVPAQPGSRLTVEFDIPSTSNSNEESGVATLKASVDYPEREEDVTLMLYDMTGRVVQVSPVYKVVNGKAVLYLDLNHITSGRYILRAQGPNWSDAKNILVK